MKILWCSHAVPDYKKQLNNYNGCGWISSLLHEVSLHENLQIAVAFFCQEEEPPIKCGNVTYYPLFLGHVNIIGKIKSYFGNFEGWLTEEKKHLDRLEGVINDFKPDVIHVWGTESDMALISTRTNIPVVIHMQGVLSPIYNSLLPPGFSIMDFCLQKGCNPKNISNQIATLHNWRFKAERETRILRQAKYVMGRTQFDYAVCKLLSPNVQYIYCSEILRDSFYQSSKWKQSSKNKNTILSTLSNPLYKGIDMVLKTAKVLKESCHLEFEWCVVGISDISFVEKRIGIKANEVNVKCLGVKTADEIIGICLKSSIYLHTSYIDNSPNSVCEAQIMGLPVVATNVGGVSSLIEENETGWLVPANDPYICAYRIVEILNNPQKTKEVSENEIRAATKRHSKSLIVKTLVDTYKKIVNEP